MQPEERLNGTASGERPNIILINCDDLGYGDLGCYGSECNATPYLDRLAAEGLRLTDFYMAAPVCSASRAALLTGCYPARIGFGEYPVLFPGQGQGLDPQERTLAKQLKAVGYDTKIVGKWHCGDQPEFLPTRHGFDEYFGIPFSNDMGRQACNDFKHPPLPLMRNEEVIQQQPDQRGITERYVDESLQFIRRERDVPFFLYLAHMYVHVPLFVPKQFLETSRNGAYGGAVACIDWAMGMIDAELTRLGIREETLVIFTSDNGSRASGEGGSNGPLRGTKSQTWEGGQRLPCILRWPGKIAAGRTHAGITASIDLYATLSELVGAPQAVDARANDSISMLELLLDGAPSRREHFAYYKGCNLEAVRKGDWKLHFCKMGWSPNGMQNVESLELYNLREDIGETRNVQAQHPEKVSELEALAEQYREQFGDRRLGRVGHETRAIGQCANPQPLTCYDPAHPYMIAYYDLADMPTMVG